MKINHIKGLLLQEFFITIRSFEVILDIGLFPMMSVILFGFLATYLAGTGNSNVAISLLTGMLLWQVIFIVQYSVSVGSLWNIWSRNLTNMFIAPITLLEYVTAYSLSGIIKAIFIFVTTSIFSAIIFNFNILDVGIINLFLYLFNLVFFAISLGLIILGLIFRFGTRIQAFAWGLLPIFQPLTAVFYPVEILPIPLQFVARALPPTYIFEALRANLENPNVIQFGLIGTALVENTIYLVVATLFFNMMFNKSKSSGQFARLEG